MVDNVKVWVLSEHLPIGFEKNPYLEFNQTVDAETQDVKKEKGATAYYKNLSFHIDSLGKLEIIGSLHKYYNAGRHNYNDFTHTQLIEVLDELESKFEINLSNTILRNIEFGVNIVPPISATETVNNTLTHLTQQYKHYSFNGAVYKESTHGRYYLKAYNKSLQYKRKGFEINREIFRYEIKYKKMYTPNNIGIVTLADLRSPKKVRIASEMIIEKWNDTIFYDPTIDLTKVSKYIKNTKIHQWQNPNWWLKMRKQNRGNQRAYMNKINAEASKGVKKIIAKRMREKINSCHHNRVPLTQVFEDGNSVPNNPLYIGVKGTLIATHFNISELISKRPRIVRQLTA